KRSICHGAFFGLLSGFLTAVVHHGLTLPEGAKVAIKGGWLASRHVYPSEMAQNFWAAIVAWTTCFLATILVSLLTRPRDEKELVGLVYSLTPRPQEEHLRWYRRPETLGIVVLVLALVLNIIFW